MCCVPLVYPSACVVCGGVSAESACSLVEVAKHRKGVIADVSIPEDELVIEYKVCTPSHPH